MKYTALVLASFLISGCNQPKVADKKQDRELFDTLQLADIRIRDPFVLANDETESYFMYAQMGNRNNASSKGVEVYTSKDLKDWVGPETVFSFPEKFWADYQVWAPEVHHYNGNYYLFVTLSNRDTLDTPRPVLSDEWPRLVKRATQILVSDSPKGPFEAFENKAHTPAEWSSLDGTLYVEEGIPYMVFCHEWTQIKDGSMELVRLKKDLSAPEGEPFTLFRAGDAEWVTPLFEYGKITDGPFLHSTQSGQLLMIWSSFGARGYAIGQAVSESGKIAGPWVQAELIFQENGGHGMIFRTLENELVLAFHQPNNGPFERAQFYKMKEEADRLVLVSKYNP